MQTNNTQETVLFSDEKITEMKNYLDNNGLINKWQESGLLDNAQSSSEKFLISSIMEAMSYRMFEMHLKENRSTDEINQFSEKYMTTMRELGVFNGSLYKQAVI